MARKDKPIKTYCVTIKSTCYREVHVDATSKKEAKEIVWEVWDGSPGTYGDNAVSSVEEEYGGQNR